jgi:uncharacterized protein YjbJ (UPF0337 family)
MADDPTKRLEVLDRIAGQREQFIGRVQERYGQTREVAERDVDDFVTDLREAT